MVARIILFVFGIVLLGFSISELRTIWTFKFDLIELRSTLRNATTYVSPHTDSRGRNSQVSNLTFYLNGYNQKYSLVENIGDAYLNREHENIARALRQADTVSIWIRESEQEKYEPKIFQIVAGQDILLDFETARKEAAPTAVMILVLGVSMMAGAIWLPALKRV